VRKHLTWWASATLITNGNIANVGYFINKFEQAWLVEFIAEQDAHEDVLALAVHPI